VRPNALFRIHATEARFRAAFCTFSPAVDLAEEGPALDAGLAQPLVERPDRAGAIGQRRVLGLVASGDLDFPSMPLLVGLRAGQRDGDPPGVRLKIVRHRRLSWICSRRSAGRTAPNLELAAGLAVSTPYVEDWQAEDRQPDQEHRAILLKEQDDPEQRRRRVANASHKRVMDAVGNGGRR
jgi:hypothetical protein